MAPSATKWSFSGLWEVETEEGLEGYLVARGARPRVSQPAAVPVHAHRSRRFLAPPPPPPCCLLPQLTRLRVQASTCSAADWCACGRPLRSSRLQNF